MAETGAPVACAQKGLPSLPPVDSSRRALEPHSVAVGEAKGSKEDGEGIGHQGCVKVRQVARPDDDEQGKDQGDEQTPGCGLEHFTTHGHSFAGRRGARRQWVVQLRLGQGRTAWR